MSSTTTTTSATIDMSYSFFSAPDFEPVYRAPAARGTTSNYTCSSERKEATDDNDDDDFNHFDYNSHPNLFSSVSTPTSTSTSWPMSPSSFGTASTIVPTQVDIWIPDSTYGYFSCPTFHLEPVMDRKMSAIGKRRIEKIVRGKTENSEGRKPPIPFNDDEEDDGYYSYFGI